MLDDEAQARRRWKAKRFWVRQWVFADRRQHFGHYDHLIRELRMEDGPSFFNYEGMEPLMFDEILNRVGLRIQKGDVGFKRAVKPGHLKFARTPRS